LYKLANHIAFVFLPPLLLALSEPFPLDNKVRGVETPNFANAESFLLNARNQPTPLQPSPDPSFQVASDARLLSARQ